MFLFPSFMYIKKKKRKKILIKLSKIKIDLLFRIKNKKRLGTRIFFERLGTLISGKVKIYFWWLALDYLSLSEANNAVYPFVWS